ncbi:MAG: hypothetical protein PVF05_08215 [Gemmatimonadales bacterium]|jgi:hypothetical protein
MPQLSRHQIGASLLGALRQEGLGVRDLFEGRQEPVSWFFRCLAYDQSELDIMESGAIDTLHAPSALLELTLDEVALAGAGIGPEGLASYLAGEGIPDVEELFPDPPHAASRALVEFHPDVVLGVLSVDVAPPALWLEERSAEPAENERLARQLAGMAQRTGGEADTVEVHIEGALDASAEGWADDAAGVRPAGVSVHFSFEIPLAGTDERELGRIFLAGARTSAGAIEAMRGVFGRGI